MLNVSEWLCGLYPETTSELLVRESVAKGAGICTLPQYVVVDAQVVWLFLALSR